MCEIFTLDYYLNILQFCKFPFYLQINLPSTNIFYWLLVSEDSVWYIEYSFTYFGMTVGDFRYMGYSCSNDMFGAIAQTSLHSTRILRFLMYVYVNDHAVNGSVLSLLLHLHFLLVWPNGLVRCSFPIFHFWNKVLIVASYAPFVKMRDQRGNKWILTGDSNNCIFCYWLPYFIDD
jgi:hypothetical protein